MMKSHSLLCLFFVLTLCLFAQAEQSSFVQIEGNNLLTQKAIQIPLQKINKKGTIIVFLSAKCPCSNSHRDTLEKLAKKYQDYQFVGIHSNYDESEEMTKKYFMMAHFPFPIIRDGQMKIANQFKALKTPHSFLLNQNGEIIYQGGVTNSAHADSADRHYLDEALADHSQNKEIRTKLGRTLGCAIQRNDAKNVW